MNRSIDSVTYYNQNSEDYFNSTKGFDMSYLYNLFLPHIPKGGKILDAGCGSGRDTKYFLEQQYDVTAIDGSANLAALASAYTGQNVRTLKFQDINYDHQFDGIWASASLLHVPKSDIQDVLKKIYRALKKDGILYTSFRYGEEESFEENRYFNDQTEESLKDLLLSMGPIEILHLSIPESLRSRRGFKFVSSVVRKTSL
jgi:SAM-dependent methyltransferase